MMGIAYFLGVLISFVLAVLSYMGTVRMTSSYIYDVITERSTAFRSLTLIFYSPQPNKKLFCSGSVSVVVLPGS